MMTYWKKRVVEEAIIHINELDVHNDYQRKGIGKTLLTLIIHQARTDNKRITFTTFKHVLWNALFYKKLGFRIMAECELTPRLINILNKETDIGLPIEERCAMSLDFKK